ALHVGHSRGDWRSYDMFNGGDKTTYRTSSTYYSAHGGIGYQMALNDSLSLDLYDKYFWTHIGSDHANIAGDRFKFKSINSNLNRLGARLTHHVVDDWDIYAGGAWEHEFNGKARASVYGLSTTTPSLRGDSGIFELGFKTHSN